MVSSEQQALFLFTVYAVTLYAWPPDYVLRVLGGTGFVAGIVGLLLFGIWLALVVTGLHRPFERRHPTRPVLAVLWVTSIMSYIGSAAITHTEAERNSAVRWLILLAIMTGIIGVTAEGIRTLGGLRRALSRLVAAATLCGLVAVIQYFLKLDPTELLRSSLPGFSTQGAYQSFLIRGHLSRVTGTSLHPIELGAVATILSPVAISLLFHDRTRPLLRRAVPFGVLLLCVPMSVSRSALLGLAVGVALYLVFQPATERANLMALMGAAAIVVLGSTPGYLSTITRFISRGADDPSIANRVNNYPRVDAMFHEHPWLGIGGGTYFVPNLTQVLDNQYLKGLVELGLIGLIGLVAFLVLPAIFAFIAMARTDNSELRAYAAGLGAGATAAAVLSLTFDSLSFYMFAGTYAALVGLIGSCSAISHSRRRAATGSPPRTASVPSMPT